MVALKVQRVADILKRKRSLLATQLREGFVEMAVKAEWDSNRENGIPSR